MAFSKAFLALCLFIALSFSSIEMTLAARHLLDTPAASPPALTLPTVPPLPKSTLPSFPTVPKATLPPLPSTPLPTLPKLTLPPLPNPQLPTTPPTTLMVTLPPLQAIPLLNIPTTIPHHPTNTNNSIPLPIPI